MYTSFNTRTCMYTHSSAKLALTSPHAVLVYHANSQPCVNVHEHVYLCINTTAGHLEVVQFLSANRVEGGSVRAMNTAALNGHLDVVAWLHANRKEGATEKAMDNAAKNG
jgi:hypothetical protein